ncbi:hypothetical protein EDM57_05330 [Brevibacillus gelatini]|uniref:Uncharacterized protein n=1 Tax=Brevibacillus gelatini TaxID=1655277 RepID=A0A3M8B852_9BACL|nr:hypothetical protein [Brevibacillus gelatini]RNB59177.1 hypothetical protein EDM57_05330 [Brevibacillus gelatini]
MEDRELAVLTELIAEAYPQLETVVNVDDWMTQRFSLPAAFLMTRGIGETGRSHASYQVEAEAVIVLHYPKVEGVYQRLSAEPLRQLLRQSQYSYRGKASGLSIEIDSSTLRIWRDRRDRTEIAFRFTYIVTVPREDAVKINEFEIEEGHS